MALLDHPKDVEDLSGEKGFQWKFHSDICSNGFDTTFVSSRSAASTRRLGFLGRGLEIAGGMAASSALWGAGQAADAAGRFRNMFAEWHNEHDNGVTHGVNEAKGH